MMQTLVVSMLLALTPAMTAASTSRAETAGAGPQMRHARIGISDSKQRRRRADDDRRKREEETRRRWQREAAEERHARAAAAAAAAVAGTGAGAATAGAITAEAVEGTSMTEAQGAERNARIAAAQQAEATAPSSSSSSSSTEPTIQGTHKPIPPEVIAMGIALLVLAAGALLVRRARRRCRKCGGKMILLGDDQLNAGQRMEQKLGSVTHTLRECKRCSIIRHTWRRSRLNARETCRRCGFDTVQEHTLRMRDPQNGAPGFERISSICKFCDHAVGWTQEIGGCACNTSSEDGALPTAVVVGGATDLAGSLDSEEPERARASSSSDDSAHAHAHAHAMSLGAVANASNMSADSDDSRNPFGFSDLGSSSDLGDSSSSFSFSDSGSSSFSDSGSSDSSSASSSDGGSSSGGGSGSDW